MPDNSPNRPVSGEDPWLTVPQVSAQLRIHPATVRIWIKSGRLAAVRVGREWRVRQSEVDRALRLRRLARVRRSRRPNPRDRPTSAQRRGLRRGRSPTTS